MTAAAAVEPGPAALAGFLGEHRGRGEIPDHLIIKGLFRQDGAHLELRHPHKLMAGIDIPLRGDRHILCPRPAPQNPFDDTGPPAQVDLEVEEVEALTGLFLGQHGLRQGLILCAQLRDVRFLQRVGLIRRGHHGLHGHLVEAQLRHMEHILGKILAEPGEGTP